jgi:hypothetical protein
VPLVCDLLGTEDVGEGWRGRLEPPPSFPGSLGAFRSRRQRTHDSSALLELDYFERGSVEPSMDLLLEEEKPTSGRWTPMRDLVVAGSLVHRPRSAAEHVCDVTHPQEGRASRRALDVMGCYSLHLANVQVTTDRDD